MKRLLLGLLATVLLASPTFAADAQWSRLGYQYYVLTVTSDTLASGAIDTTLVQPRRDLDWVGVDETYGSCLAFSVFPLSASTDTFSVIIDISPDNTNWVGSGGLATQTYPPFDEEIFLAPAPYWRIRTTNADVSGFPLNYKLVFIKKSS